MTTKNIKKNNQSKLVKNSHKSSWNNQEDDLLFRLVSVHGIESWILIASKLKENGYIRQGKQCRERCVVKR